MKETLRALVELQDLEDSLRDLRRMTQRLGRLRQENQETRELFEGMLARGTHNSRTFAVSVKKKSGDQGRKRSPVGRALASEHPVSTRVDRSE